ncbi:MAG: MarC family protein [Candidatus Micrarchaeota archaeon]
MLEVVQSLILLLVIMDPVVSLSALMALTKHNSADERRKIALKSVFVAALVFFGFAFGGNTVLQLLGVDINTFKAAGGVILVLLGVQLALGVSFPKEKEDINEAAVVIGTPLISGPAVISTTIILVQQTGLLSTLTAGSLALALVLISLLAASRINKVIGRSGMRVLSTMMGVVTIAWGIQFLLSGINAFA